MAFSVLGDNTKGKITKELPCVWIALWIVPTTLGWAWTWKPDAGGSPPSNLMLLAWNGTHSDLIVPFEAALGAFYGLVLVGPILGVGQWLTLRLYGHHIGWWIPATVCGATAGWMLSSGLSSPICLLIREAMHQDVYTIVDWRTNIAFVVSGTLVSLVAGLSIGVCQWPVLLLSGIHRAVWWIPLSGVCWAIAGTTFWTAYRAFGGSLYYQGAPTPPAEPLPAHSASLNATIYGWLIGGLVLGLFTGLILKLLTKYTVQYGSTISQLDSKT